MEKSCPFLPWQHSAHYKLKTNTIDYQNSRTSTAAHLKLTYCLLRALTEYKNTCDFLFQAPIFTRLLPPSVRIVDTSFLSYLMILLVRLLAHPTNWMHFSWKRKRGHLQVYSYSVQLCNLSVCHDKKASEITLPTIINTRISWDIRRRRHTQFLKVFSIAMKIQRRLFSVFEI